MRLDDRGLLLLGALGHQIGDTHGRVHLGQEGQTLQLAPNLWHLGPDDSALLKAGSRARLTLPASRTRRFASRLPSTEATHSTDREASVASDGPPPRPPRPAMFLGQYFAATMSVAEKSSPLKSSSSSLATANAYE